MTSNINFAGINEQFPVAGQDNDTQVFRDNFDTIKTSFRTAQTEITDLQNNSARLDQINDYNLNVQQRAVFLECREEKWDYENWTAASLPIDFQKGPYQIVTLFNNVSMEFTNFPGDPVYSSEVRPIGMGKVTLELYSNNVSYTVNFVTSGGTVIKKSPDFPAPFVVSSNSNPIFLEVWRHSQDVIFLKYLGQYS